MVHIFYSSPGLRHIFIDIAKIDTCIFYLGSALGLMIFVAGMGYIIRFSAWVSPFLLMFWQAQLGDTPSTLRSMELM